MLPGSQERARRASPRWRRLAPALLLAACDGPQSALDPAGVDAEQIARLFTGMAVGAAVIWTAVIGLAVYVVRIRRAPDDERTARLLILGAGAIVPTITLGALLTWGLAMMPALLAPGPAGGVVVAVTGEQWWWRVRYLPPDGPPIELANEIRLPVGHRINLVLDTPDVIHSFWVPSLAGKTDMIPGRVTTMALEPTRTGVFRGACAEFCGTSHALMSFFAVVLEEDAFDAWLAHQAKPAAPPDGPVAARGREVFLTAGCGACHTVRGTPADGVVGPDLTHVGGRVSLAAGILDVEVDDLVAWISRPEAIKPGVHMPAFGMLPDDDLRALATWLEGLE